MVAKYGFSDQAENDQDQNTYHIRKLTINYFVFCDLLNVTDSSKGSYCRLALLHHDTSQTQQLQTHVSQTIRNMKSVTGSQSIQSQTFDSIGILIFVSQ